MLNLWDALQLAWLQTAIAIADFMGDMKANVLTLLQDLVNGAIDIINGLIEAVNKIPCVEIEAIQRVTFGATAQVENEAAKQARAGDLAKFRGEVNSRAADRRASAAQARAEAAAASAQRQAEIAALKAEKAQKQTGASGDTAAWENYQGGANVGNVENVGEVGKIKDDINLAEEDIRFLRDVAEMRFVQNFVTLTPTVAVDAKISKDVDEEKVYRQIEKRLEEEFVAAAEGVYR